MWKDNRKTPLLFSSWRQKIALHFYIFPFPFQFSYDLADYLKALESRIALQLKDRLAKVDELTGLLEELQSLAYVAAGRIWRRNPTKFSIFNVRWGRGRSLRPSYNGALAGIGFWNFWLKKNNFARFRQIVLGFFRNNEFLTIS